MSCSKPSKKNNANRLKRTEKIFSKNQEDKVLIESLKKKIFEKLKDPAKIKKAAQIISNMIKS